MIVDSQVHIWLSGTPASRHKQLPKFAAEDLFVEMERAGVTHAILNAPDWDRGATPEAVRDGAYDINETTIDAARRYPERLAVIRWISPAQAGLADRLPRLLEPQVLGTRMMFTGHAAHQLKDGTSDWYWPAAEKYRIPTTLRLSGGEAIDHIGAVAERHPNLPLVIDHLGTQHRSGGPKGVDIDDAAFAYQPHLLKLAKLKNVAIKASGATDYSSQPYPHENIHKYLREIYDHFGPERMFWGSDMSRLRGSYRECVTMFTEAMPWLSQSDKELIMGKAYCKWFNVWTH
jgi:predicted TIM-barrel fold metal-dependent hydrolase